MKCIETRQLRMASNKTNMYNTYIQIKGQEIDVCDDYKYLQVQLNKQGNCWSETENRITVQGRIDT